MDGKLQLRLDAPDIDDRVEVETREPVSLDEWQHVTAVYDGSRLARGIQIFVDGKHVGGSDDLSFVRPVAVADSRGCWRRR